MLVYNRNMGKKERLSREIDLLREGLGRLFSVILALATGVVIVIYAIVSGDKPIYLLVMAGLGVGPLVLFAFRYRQSEERIYELLDELEKEE